jgi:polyvinyl alcohol dehydrogenase (cytochrome)
MVRNVYVSFAFLTVLCFGAEDGARVYQEHCAQCHESGAVRIPSQSVLRQHTSAGIRRTLEAGVMKQQSSLLTSEQRQAVALWLGGATPVSVDSSRVANSCKAPVAASGDKRSAWTSWGAGLENRRFQDSEGAGFAGSDVSKLKLKWAFGVPNAATMRSQPALYGGRVFFGAETSFYYLDAASGCSYWVTELTANIRSGIAIAEDSGNLMLFFGDENGQVQALDGNTGKPLWKVHLDAHPATLVTGTPAYYQGRLYVPFSSAEEAFATLPGYLCCTFRGEVAALDAVSGKSLWRTYTIDEPAKPGPALKNGAKSAGPSGAGVWSSPTIDTKAGVLYVVTGDNYSQPATATSDAVMALSMETGKVQWSRQLRAGDAFNVSCLMPGQINCPDSAGPDFDFAASAVLTTLADGNRLLVLAQKSGALYAIDPDHQGKAVWQSQVGKGGVLGGIEWGVAVDGNRVYAGLSDLAFLPRKAADQASDPDPTQGGGMFAFKIENGERLWMTPPPGCGDRHPCSPAQSAAVSAVRGAVFSGSLDGHIRAYSTDNGKIVWDYDTAHDYQTVNGVAGKGGSLNGGGPVIAAGTLLVNSGYGEFGETKGNVLLAFSLDVR